MASRRPNFFFLTIVDHLTMRCVDVSGMDYYAEHVVRGFLSPQCGFSGNPIPENFF